MAVLDHIELPNGITYDISDASARKLDNNDFDTINVTELNAGDVIVTGAARFLNTINGSISGNAVTATKATQDESGNNIKASYASSISISDHTITLKNKNGVSLGTVTVPDNNDNTWRKVQVNGTDILGTATNTNPLNLKAGTNVSLSNSSGTVTIAATDTNTTYSLSASGESVVLSGSDNSSSTANLSTAFANYTPYKGNLTSIIGSASPASAMKTYWENNDNIKPTSVNTAYNTAGQEYAFLLSKGGTNQYGAVIRWGYGTKYFEILRKYGSTWKDDDWVKMDAGYADSAGADSDGNAINTTYLKKTDLITNNAGFHNSIYRGKSLGTSITTAQWNAISAGTFDDMYIGDYWTLSTTIGSTTSNVQYVIAGFDYWWNCGDSYPQSSNKHHIVLVPASYLYTAQMNATNITTGGYIGSAMYTTNLENARTGISTLFGDHLYSVRRSFTNSVNTVGQATGWAWATSSVDLMSETMVYGHPVWTTSGFEVGVDRTILPLFALNPASASTRSNWWLRSVATPSYFALVSYSGYADCYYASLSLGVRPAFAIY